MIITSKSIAGVIMVTSRRDSSPEDAAFQILSHLYYFRLRFPTALGSNELINFLYDSFCRNLSVYGVGRSNDKLQKVY